MHIHAVVYLLSVPLAYMNRARNPSIYGKTKPPYGHVCTFAVCVPTYVQHDIIAVCACASMMYAQTLLQPTETSTCWLSLQGVGQIALALYLGVLCARPQPTLPPLTAPPRDIAYVLC